MSKMNPEIKARWLVALRSGKYAQGKGELRSAKDCFCCLGVLCDIKGEEWVPHEEDPSGPYSYKHSSAFDYPPREVSAWAGLDWFEVMVDIDGNTTYLADHNDNGHTFAEIADAIEAQL